MSVDVRFRVDGQEPTNVDPATFFDHELPAALDAAGSTLDAALDWLRLRPLTITVAEGGGDSDSTDVWTLSVDGRVRVERGPASHSSGYRSGDGLALHLTPEQLGQLVSDQATFMGFFTWGTLDQRAGRLEHLLDWWLVLRGVLDGRPVYTPGTLSFTDPEGGPLDLDRSFHLDDDPEAMRSFLEEAGFLRIEGVFDRAEMRALEHEMDVHAKAYAPDDGRSWWATTADGDERLVRLQFFEQHSDAAAALLADTRFLSIGAITGDGHEPRGSCSALVKPIGVVAGISDVPWHKDCSLGRHSYDCCGLTVGVSVTGADATSGQLRVIAGSHRALVWPAFSRKGTGLPEIDLPTATGDVTVHLSCTTHMSQPPVDRERRVVYSGFALPPSDPGTVAAARKELYRIMQSIPEGVSQKPTVSAAPTSG